MQYSRARAHFLKIDLGEGSSRIEHDIGQPVDPGKLGHREHLDELSDPGICVTVDRAANGR